MRTLLTRLRKNPEEGSLAAYFVLLVVVLMGVVGLVVDSAGKYTAAEEAQAVVGRPLHSVRRGLYCRVRNDRDRRRERRRCHRDCDDHLCHQVHQPPWREHPCRGR